MTRREVELLAVGAGPSNLGLAVALEELAPDLAEHSLIIDRNPVIQWQSGMLLPWAKSQVSFLKDLVSLRNPRSTFTFLNFLKSTGRLDGFVNLGSLLPYRLEISAYLKWVAESLTRMSVELGCDCVGIEPTRNAAGTLTGWQAVLADGGVIASRYLVIATGRDANIPSGLAGLPAERVIHSSGYRAGVAGLASRFPYRVALIGASQSAAEMFRALRTDLPESEIAWLMRSVGPTADPSSKFTNELYYPAYVDEFYNAPAAGRDLIRREMYRTNYSCVTPPTLQHLYTELYRDRLDDRRDRRLITLTEVTAAREADGEVILELTSRVTGETTALHCDLVFLGTGFSWGTPRLIRSLADTIGLAQVEVDRNYRLVVDGPAEAACYLQGVNEATHGIGDSLLSVLARRTGEIVLDIAAHRRENPVPADRVETDLSRQREEAYLALRAAMPAPNLAEALRCASRLLAALPHEDLHRNRVLVAYGGGKDSSYTLAFVRAMQLVLFRVYGTTFRLRVATNRHAGMPHAVMANIDREYQALRLYADPDCELLLIDGDEVSVFDVDSPQRDHVVRRNRLDILMTGHRTFADGRPTFCNACNLSVFNSFGLAAAYGDGADLIITGDSQDEQRRYSAWVSRMSRRIGGTGKPRHSSGFGLVLSRLDEIGQAYVADIHGADAAAEIAERRVTADVPQSLRFFSIYADTGYRAGDHMEMLLGFLGFRFDDVAFSFTESDCGNPALMAHLRGLKCERVYRRSYAEGLAEYVDFATNLMRDKDFPPELVEQIRARYEGPGAAQRMRSAMADYARTTFGLTEEHLVCMAYSPFAEKAAGLARFLSAEHPELTDQVDAVRVLLADDTTGDPHLAATLERISGLELRRLRVLYGRSLRNPGRDEEAEPIDVVLAGDPHQALIRTRHTPDGPHTLEQISGR